MNAFFNSSPRGLIRFKVALIKVTGLGEAVVCCVGISGLGLPERCFVCYFALQFGMSFVLVRSGATRCAQGGWSLCAGRASGVRNGGTGTVGCFVWCCFGGFGAGGLLSSSLQRVFTQKGSQGSYYLCISAFR